MEDRQKRSLAVSLVLLGSLAPIFLMKEHQDCYPNKVECTKDWGQDCENNTVPSNNGCQYLGRSYYGYGRGYYSSGVHSVGSISRGGFGALGHAMGGG